MLPSSVEGLGEMLICSAADECLGVGEAIYFFLRNLLENLLFSCPPVRMVPDVAGHGRSSR